MARREDRAAQAKVLRAVLLAAEKGLADEDLEERCAARGAAGLGAAEIDAAVEALLASGLPRRVEARLRPSGAATRFNRLRPL